MRTTHTSFPLAGHTLHHLHFSPESFADADLLWLPHHPLLATSGRKRKAEHLAGRMAAAQALYALTGQASVPGIGSQREPLWPAGIFGSISHCGQQALAVVSRLGPLGVDIEEIADQTLAQEIEGSVIDDAEREVLRALPFPLAVTLAFSAKESAYKAFPAQVTGFASVKISALHADRLILTFTGHPPATAHWQQRGETLLTLVAG